MPLGEKEIRFIKALDMCEFVLAKEFVRDINLAAFRESGFGGILHALSASRDCKSLDYYFNFFSIYEELEKRDDFDSDEELVLCDFRDNTPLHIAASNGKQCDA